MVLTNDRKLAERMRVFRNHGMVRPDARRPWNYEISEIGYNYRITDIQCALGLSQLRRLDSFLERRRALADRYIAVLADSPFVSLPAIPDNATHAWHIFVVLLNLQHLTTDRDTIMEALHAENIGVQLHYPLVHSSSLLSAHVGIRRGPLSRCGVVISNANDPALVPGHVGRRPNGCPPCPGQSVRELLTFS